MNAGSPVLVFDVNETLYDLSPLAARFVEVGAPASMSALWFTTLLRDGFALTIADSPVTFPAVAGEVLRVLLPTVGLTRPLEEAVDHVVAGFGDLELHPDVACTVRGLAEQGHRLVTLSNASASVAEKLLTNADVRDQFEHVLSVDDAGAWKPDRRAYEFAARTCGVGLDQMLMIGVHPWDIDGAARAGMVTAWLDRSESYYPATFRRPVFTLASLEELSEIVGEPSP